MIKKILKFLIWTVLIVMGLLIATYFVLNKPLPKGTVGDKAEDLADKMLTTLNKEAFDSLKYISFTFKGLHQHKWNLEANTVTVSWDSLDVFVNLNRPTDSYDLIEYQAYEYFINDSFWLVAPFKVRDAGVIRSTVDVEDGEGLLVSYTSGGVTPGDSYLWILDEDGFPKAWKLWTSIVPIGGVSFSWEDWETHQNTWICTRHKSALLDLDIEVHEVW